MKILIECFNKIVRIGYKFVSFTAQGTFLKAAISHLRNSLVSFQASLLITFTVAPESRRKSFNLCGGGDETF